MDSDKVAFDGPPDAELNYFLISKNLALPNNETEERVKALYLHLVAKHFWYQNKRFTGNVEHTKEVQDYDLEKDAIHGQFGEKPDSQLAFEKAVALQFGRGDYILAFLEFAKLVCDDAVLTKQQKFVFLSKP